MSKILVTSLKDAAYGGYWAGPCPDGSLSAQSCLYELRLGTMGFPYVAQTGPGPGILGWPALIPAGPRPGSLSGIDAPTLRALSD